MKGEITGPQPVRAVSILVTLLLDTLEKEGVLSVEARHEFYRALREILPAIADADAAMGDFLKAVGKNLEEIGTPTGRPKRKH